MTCQCDDIVKLISHRRCKQYKQAIPQVPCHACAHDVPPSRRESTGTPRQWKL